jgi:hypothetical protein
LNVGTSRVISNAESEGENLDLATSVLDDSDDENVKKLENSEFAEQNINLDVMINDVTEDFIDISENFKIFGR